MFIPDLILIVSTLACFGVGLATGDKVVLGMSGLLGLAVIAALLDRTERKPRK